MCTSITLGLLDDNNLMEPQPIIEGAASPPTLVAHEVGDLPSQRNMFSLIGLDLLVLEDLGSRVNFTLFGSCPFQARFFPQRLWSMPMATTHEDRVNLLKVLWMQNGCAVWGNGWTMMDQSCNTNKSKSGLPIPIRSIGLDMMEKYHVACFLDPRNSTRISLIKGTTYQSAASC